MQVVRPISNAATQVFEDRLHLPGVCHSCGRSLSAEEPERQTDTSLPVFLAGTELPVLIDFWAAWSGSSKAMEASFAEAAKLMPSVRFGQVDNNAAPISAARYSIRRIPTLILFKRCIEIARFTGLLSTEQLVAWVQQQLRPTGAKLNNSL